jgi:hypothetical protein
MGCDIHAYVETKRNGKWTAKGKVKNPYYSPEYDRPEEEYKVPEEDIRRDYYFFGIIAGVRDYEKFPNIEATPRGLPPDVTLEVLQEKSNWSYDAHSMSWLSFDEIFDYEWPQELDWVVPFFRELEEVGLEQRLVFFFDN